MFSNFEIHVTDEVGQLFSVYRHKATNPYMYLCEGLHLKHEEEWWLTSLLCSILGWFGYKGVLRFLLCMHKEIIPIVSGGTVVACADSILTLSILVLMLQDE